MVCNPQVVMRRIKPEWMKIRRCESAIMARGAT